MVQIANYWTANSPLNVTLYTNCDEVALYLNDVLVSKEKPFVNGNRDALQHSPFVFKLDKFISGTLRAEGFIKGEKVISNVVKTPESPVKIKLSYDVSSKAINANSPDMVFVYAKITDLNGTFIPTAMNEVTFALSGENAALIGENPVKAEAEIAVIILKTKNLNSPITIKASGANLESATLKIN
ncbi:DUF4982 domain-containing protein [Flavobacterium sp. GB2R13]|uniref:DUF4982 domain-containing protein n=1 Tax=Flavobacterium algoris TaxID=3398733 RepID=UPI003A89D4E7